MFHCVAMCGLRPTGLCLFVLWSCIFIGSYMPIHPFVLLNSNFCLALHGCRGKQSCCCLWSHHVLSYVVVSDTCFCCVSLCFHAMHSIPLVFVIFRAASLMPVICVSKKADTVSWRWVRLPEKSKRDLHTSTSRRQFLSCFGICNMPCFWVLGSWWMWHFTVLCVQMYPPGAVLWYSCQWLVSWWHLYMLAKWLNLSGGRVWWHILLGEVANAIFHGRVEEVTSSSLICCWPLAVNFWIVLLMKSIARTEVHYVRCK